MYLILVLASIAILVAIYLDIQENKNQFIEVEDEKGFKFCLNKKEVVACRPDKEGRTMITTTGMQTVIIAEYDEFKKELL